MRPSKSCWGSSPRMRGALVWLFGAESPPRIIPADAGSTLRRVRRTRRGKDHPRRCGEHPSGETVEAKGEGSSPRMRGALQKQIDDLTEKRDHPRGCGEHRIFPLSCKYIVGSSPRMRGAQPWAAPRNRQAGIIPADAGSTLDKQGGGHFKRDHPRGCGEH